MDSPDLKQSPVPFVAHIEVGGFCARRLKPTGTFVPLAFLDTFSGLRPLDARDCAHPVVRRSYYLGIVINPDTFRVVAILAGPCRAQIDRYFPFGNWKAAAGANATGVSGARSIIKENVAFNVDAPETLPIGPIVELTL